MVGLSGAPAEAAVWRYVARGGGRGRGVGRTRYRAGGRASNGARYRSKVPAA